MKMLRVVFTLIIFTVFIVSLNCLAFAKSKDGGDEQKPIYKFKYATVFGPAQVKDFVRSILDKIEKGSVGRIKFSAYSSGELMPDTELIPALQAGTVQFAWTCAPCVDAPLDIIKLECLTPFAWNSGLELRDMWYNWGMGKLYKEAWEDLGKIKFLSLQVTDPIHCISTKPIKTYEDFKGLKINADSTIAPPFVDAGASTVFMPPEEFYLSGKTGVVDALMWCGATEAVTNSWNEVYKYFLTNNINGNAMMQTIVNKKLWDSLPEDIQTIISMGHKAGQIRTINYYYHGEPKYRTSEYFTLTTLSDEDWNKIKQDQFKRWDEEYAKISPRAAKIVEIWKAYRDKAQEAQWWR